MVAVPQANTVKVKIEDLSVSYAAERALNRVSFTVNCNEILGVIGPANSGKTTILRTLNRLNDLDPRYQLTGKVLIDGKDIYRDLIR